MKFGWLVMVAIIAVRRGKRNSPCRMVLTPSIRASEHPHRLPFAVQSEAYIWCCALNIYMYYIFFLTKYLLCEQQCEFGGGHSWWNDFLDVALILSTSQHNVIMTGNAHKNRIYKAIACATSSSRPTIKTYCTHDARQCTKYERCVEAKWSQK